MKIIFQFLKYIFVAVIFFCLTAMTFAQSPHTHQHSFSGAEQWATVFDDPNRDRWQKPHDVIQALAINADAAVADIGAGTGYFSIRLAHMVPRGTVYGVDAEPEMVRYLSERAKKLGLRNLFVLESKADAPQLPTKVDLVLFVDVYHHLENRSIYMKKIRDSLKPRGRIAVIDFKLDSPLGPPKHARLSTEQVKAEMKSAGFSLIEEHNFLPNQFFLIFQ